MKCRDGGEEITRENMTRNWGRTDICDSCLELRGKLVEAIGAGKLTQEQIAYIQKGKYTRRKKIQVALRKEILIADILNALAPLLSQAKAAQGLYEALIKAEQDIPMGYTECHGYKCRQVNCMSCNGDYAKRYETKYIDEALAAYEKSKEG